MRRNISHPSIKIAELRREESTQKRKKQKPNICSGICLYSRHLLIKL